MIDPASDISVVLATYNGSRFLDAQLSSIARQTLRAAEVLVYDDGSRPDELAATRAIVARYPGITFVPGGNVGIAANFSRAIAAARQPFVALADQDDLWTPDHLAALRHAIGAADLAYGDMQLIDAGGRPIGGRFSAGSRTMGMTSSDPELFNALLFNTIVWGAASLFRRDLLDARAIPATPRYHDWWLSVCAALRGGIAYADTVVIQHRMHEANGSAETDLHGAPPFWSARTVREARRRRRLRGDRMLTALTALDAASAPASGPGHLRLDARQRRALDGALRYASSLAHDRRPLARAAYALRHRRLLMPHASALAGMAAGVLKIV